MDDEHEPGGLSEEFDALRRSLAAYPADHPSRTALLADARFDLVVEVQALGPDGEPTDEATEHARAIGPGDPDHTVVLGLFADALLAEFRHTGAGVDLDAAVDATRAVLNGIPSGDPRRSERLIRLAAMLVTRFDRDERPADLDAAVTVGQEAVAALTPDHPGRDVALADLGVALSRRYELTGAAADLDATIDVSQQAVAATPLDDRHRANRLVVLCTALKDRVDRAGGRADLDALVDAGHDLVEATTDGALRRLRLSTLAMIVYRRFRQTSALSDLNMVIDALQRATAVLPASDAEHAFVQFNLGVALVDRVKQTHDVADVDAAVDAFARAVDTTALDDPARADRLTNLTWARQLRARFS